MEQKAFRKILWEEAGKAGLVLGLASTTYLFLTQLIGNSGIPAFAGAAAGLLLWCIKFAGCIWLMMFFMKRFVRQYPETDNGTAYRFGAATAVLSALVYAAAAFANTAFISADTINESIQALMGQMAPALDSNSATRMEEIIEKLPQVTFFSNLIYCTIYGSTLSFILSRNIPNRNPFAENNSDE